MKEQKIQVLISIANSLAIAFMGIAGGLYIEWKNKASLSLRAYSS
ncbi:MAG TPA: hypothetical protein VG737_01320 [Cyclobacteriaceae bacterium]|nr:hypothetical protein [Cyclobacteriaceae bacterium]